MHEVGGDLPGCGPPAEDAVDPQLTGRPLLEAGSPDDEERHLPGRVGLPEGGSHLGGAPPSRRVLPERSGTRQAVESGHGVGVVEDHEVDPFRPAEVDEVLQRGELRADGAPGEEDGDIEVVRGALGPTAGLLGALTAARSGPEWWQVTG